MDDQSVTRRDFLGGALAAGALAFVFPLPFNSKTTIDNASFSPSALLRIGADNRVSIILNKVEMGQGIWTTLPMLIAEELDCDWEKIDISHRISGADTDFSESVFRLSTGGSDTVKSEFDRYRTTGAIARTMLVAAAAGKYNVTADKCSTKDSHAHIGNLRIPYGELVGLAAKLPIPAVELRKPQEWKLIGRPQKRLDIAEKINGKAIYGIDIQLPGLLTAVVSRAPIFGAKLKSFDAGLAKKIVGVVDVVQVPTGVAVIATNFWSAQQGRNALVTEWDSSDIEKTDTRTLTAAYQGLTSQPGRIVRENGSPPENAHLTTYDVTWTFPYLAHSPMETLNCTVRLANDRCEIWTATQSQSLHQAEVAAFLGLKNEQVTIYTPTIGGSFGRRGSLGNDWVIEAVQVARECGRMVKLVWSREDDIRGGYYRPVYVHRAIIGVDREGFPKSWVHRVAGQSLFVNTPLEKDIAPNGIDYSTVDGINGNPYFGRIPHVSIELHTTKGPVPVLPWRSVGNTHTAFVMETMIDELAFHAQKDPVVFRRMTLEGQARHLGVLEMLVEKSGWYLELRRGRFRGIALHEAMGSVVGQVAEVSVDDGEIIVHKVTCVIDCGLAVNPDCVAAQMEGSITYGLTAALYGEISLREGQVVQHNFDDYPMLRMNRSPEIAVHISPGFGKMGGAGEPGVAPIAPAVANALFAALGKRMRTLPLQKQI